MKCEVTFIKAIATNSYLKRISKLFFFICSNINNFFQKAEFEDSKHHYYLYLYNSWLASNAFITSKRSKKPFGYSD